jgi:Ion channel
MRMDMAMTISLALASVVATVIIHYEVLRGTSLLIPRLSIPPRGRILVVIAGVFVAHLMAIFLYAFIFFLMHAHFELGSIDGWFDGEALDFFYFSITSYTTLGVGDLFPHGSLRVVAGIEALNGFVLIGWSASFTYLSMERFWELHRR